ncbi:MAG TPA: hypothetical protein HPP83_01395, partial [Candidatus Hydrogenedentes bacterium]|nr:hypothetical protein [Candidatus Hydrogenedentota bacterium]
MPFDRHLLIPGLEHIEAEPNATRLVNTLLRKEMPDRVLPMELIIDDEVIAAVLGRPITG